MCRYKITCYLLALTVLCLMQTTLGCSPELRKQATTIAKDSGLSEAGETCENEEKCKELLQCNQIKVPGTYGRTQPVCQIKDWLIGILFTLVILIPVLLLAVIFYFCQKHHCCSRILYRVTKRESVKF